MDVKEKAILLFDWDDTLVKSTSKFMEIKEKVAKKIIEYSNEKDTNKLVDCFDQREIQNMKEQHCKGYDNFRISLMQVAYETLNYDFFKKGLYEYINQEINVLSKETIEFIDGAEETIEGLFDRGYQMYIVSKVNKEEQEIRILSSDIVRYFKEIIFIKQKDEEAYIKTLKRYNLNIKECIMIGNSPKSDINPPKKIGMQTILIPNDKTWRFEKEPIISGKPETIVLKKIIDLLKHDWYVMR